MGCYAERVRAKICRTAPEPPLDTQSGWVVITESDWSPARIRGTFPSCARLLVLQGAPAREHTDRVRFGQILSGPSRLADPAAAELERGYSAVILLDGRSSVSGRVLIELARAGIRKAAYRDGLGWVVRPLRWLIAGKPVARIEKYLATSRVGSWYRIQMSRARAHENLLLRNRRQFAGEAEWYEHLDRVGIVPTPQREPGDPMKVVLHIGQLNSGGAERQLVNLAIALRRRGHVVRVLTTYPLSDENAHYLDLLEGQGVPVGTAGSKPVEGVDAAFERVDLHPELIGALAEEIRGPVLDLAGELLADPPDILHCWLDHPNVVGGIAGAIVGTPQILLSTRNLNPTNFPAFYQTWMDLWYRNLAQLPQVRILANSRAGADDYAAWMGVDPSQFDVIPNGVDIDAMGNVTRKEIRAFRREIKLRRGQPLVAAVFRLAPEKQPMLFLDVIERVKQRVPKLRVVMAGVGPMQAEIEEAIAARGLRSTVQLLGQRKDVRVILASADALLLTSNAEGTPNVVMEAQLLGCPAVATDVGGTREIMEPGITGFLRPREDVAGMANDLARILLDRDLRSAMAAAGTKLLTERFSMDRIFEQTEAFYECLLSGSIEDESKPEAPVASSRASFAAKEPTTSGQPESLIRTAPRPPL